MKLQVTHATRYRYAPAVEWAQHVAHLRPRDMPGQRLQSHRLRITPGPDELRHSRDVFGNTRSFFALQGSHAALEVVADSVVDTTAPSRPANPIAWEAVRERLRYRAGARYDAAAQYLYRSPYVPRHADFLDYGRASFSAGRPLLEAAEDLMQRIHRDCAYVADSTDLATPAVEALARRQGVCQDFAHIMVACLRMLGLPARYVSGYLLTQPPPGQPRLIGADASHAWVAVHVPGVDGHDGWYDFDPTNGRAPGEDYVTLAVGRDFSDVSPMRGVLQGGASHQLQVGVTVQPLAADPSPTGEIPP